MAQALPNAPAIQPLRQAVAPGPQPNPGHQLALNQLPHNALNQPGQHNENGQQMAQGEPNNIAAALLHQVMQVQHNNQPGPNNGQGQQIAQEDANNAAAAPMLQPHGNNALGNLNAEPMNMDIHPVQGGDNLPAPEAEVPLNGGVDGAMNPLGGAGNQGLDDAMHMAEQLSMQGRVAYLEQELVQERQKAAAVSKAEADAHNQLAALQIQVAMREKEIERKNAEAMQQMQKRLADMEARVQREIEQKKQEVEAMNKELVQRRKEAEVAVKEAEQKKKEAEAAKLVAKAAERQLRKAEGKSKRVSGPCSARAVRTSPCSQCTHSAVSAPILSSQARQSGPGRRR